MIFVSWGADGRLTLFWENALRIEFSVKLSGKCVLMCTCAYVRREAACPMALSLILEFISRRTLKLSPLLLKTRREQKVLHFLRLLLTLRLCTDNEDDQIRALVGLLQESIFFLLLLKKCWDFFLFFSPSFCEIPGSWYSWAEIQHRATSSRKFCDVCPHSLIDALTKLLAVFGFEIKFSPGQTEWEFGNFFSFLSIVSVNFPSKHCFEQAKSSNSTYYRHKYLVQFKPQG